MLINIEIHYDEEDKDVHIMSTVDMYDCTDYGYTDNGREVKETLRCVVDNVLEDLRNRGLGE